MERFLFCHIWKAAGSSLHDVFRQSVPGYRIVDAENKVPANVWLARYPAVGGHLLWEHIESSVGKAGCVSCVVLRDPVERALSHFFFNRKLSPLSPANDCDLETVLRHIDPNTEQCHLLSNLQTAVLAGRARASTDPMERLEAAKDALRRFTHVGTTDRLDAFVARVLGPSVSAQAGVPILNTNPNRGQVPDRLRQRLAELNQADQALFEYARQLAASPTPPVPSAPTPSGPAQFVPFGNRTNRIKQSRHSLASDSSGIPVIEIEAVCTSRPGEFLSFGVRIVDEIGFSVFGIAERLPPPPDGGATPLENHLRLSIALPVAPGRYAVDLSLNSEFAVCHFVPAAFSFEIVSWSKQPFVGRVHLSHSKRLAGDLVVG